MTETVRCNGKDIPVRAYLHARSDHCVSPRADTYANPRKLVAWDDVVDHIDWLEHGIVEWREEALNAMQARRLCQQECARVCEELRAQSRNSLFRSALTIAAGYIRNLKGKP